MTLMPLGRIAPPDYDHVEKFALAALPPEEQPVHVPVSIGVNWHTSFDTPVLGSDGKYRLPSSNLGTVRGGHCTCLEPAPDPSQPGQEQDTEQWWAFYNQGKEGACEGFGHSRALSILRRSTFDAFWLYDQARKLEGTYPEGEGTSNRAVCEVLRTIGIRTQAGTFASRSETEDGQAELAEGIAAYRWATTADEVLAALGRPGEEEIPLLNSWGTAYPKVVYLPAETLERLLKEGGEADVVTER